MIQLTRRSERGMAPSNRTRLQAIQLPAILLPAILWVAVVSCLQLVPRTAVAQEELKLPELRIDPLTFAQPAFQLPDYELPTPEETIAYIEDLKSRLENDSLQEDPKFDIGELSRYIKDKEPKNDQAVQGFVAGFAGVPSPFQQLAGALRQGARLQLVHEGKSGPFRSLTYRLDMSQTGSFNYCRYFVTKTKTGKVVAVDFYDYAKGALFSTQLLDVLEDMKARVKAAADEKEFVEQQEAENRRMMLKRDLFYLMQSGRFQQAMEQFKKLPDSLKHDSQVLMSVSIAAMQLDQMEDFLQAVTDALNKPTTKVTSAWIFVELAIYQHREEWIKASDCLKILNELVGDDPFLAGQQAVYQQAAGNREQARTLALEAIRKAPEMFMPYMVMVETAFESDDFAQMAQWLKQMYEDQGTLVLEFGDPEMDQAFAASPEGKKWLAFAEEEAAKIGQ